MRLTVPFQMLIKVNIVKFFGIVGVVEILQNGILFKFVIRRD